MASIQVIDRLVALLEGLARNSGSGSLKVLCAETGLPASTAFRILASAAENGLVERTAGGVYRLGPRLLALAGELRAGLDLRAEARPVMEWLRDRVGETVNLTVREGAEVVYVERATPRRTLRVEQVVGSRAPLHTTAVGKLMLGEGGREAVERYAAATALPRLTPGTRGDLATLWRDIETSTGRGYAFDDEEAEPGVGCIGALVRDHTGQVVAGLSVSAPIERRAPEWVPLVVEAAARLSARLGYAAPLPEAPTEVGPPGSPRGAARPLVTLVPPQTTKG
jgi:DNA-binding IclR family transcriptional regulator